MDELDAAELVLQGPRYVVCRRCKGLSKADTPVDTNRNVLSICPGCLNNGNVFDPLYVEACKTLGIELPPRKAQFERVRSR